MQLPVMGLSILLWLSLTLLLVCICLANGHTDGTLIGCDLSVYLAMQKYSLLYNYIHQLQVEEARNKVSENSTKMYESVLEAHEKSKELEKLSKDLTKEIQIFSKEKEAAEKQRTEAIRKRAKLDLDYKDLQEKMSTNIKAKVLFIAWQLIDLPNCKIIMSN